MLYNLQCIQKQLREGQTTMTSIVQDCLDNIQKHQELNAYIEVWAEEALEQAVSMDERLVNEQSLGRLFGLVFSIKDVITYEGHKVSAASKILQDYTSPFSATVVERIKAEDGIFIGRTNCDEFAMGSSNLNSYYGPAKNALDPSRVPGGSSGGAAVSVAIDSCHIALGSDTGGSVRQPAAFHNIFGFKPSYGRLSRHGLIAYASSFDQIGFLGKDWSAIYETYQVCHGPDEFDSTLVERSYSRTEKELPTCPKIGVIEEVLDHNHLSKDIKDGFSKTLTKWSSHGAVQIENCHFELLDYLVPVYYILTAAEASSNLSRFDGVRYGYRDMDAKELRRMYVNSRTEGFGEEVKRRIMLGTFVLSSGYYDAYFGKAQKMRNLIKEKFNKLFTQYDFIALPVTPSGPWKREQKLKPVDIYISDIFSVIPNIIGSCAVSLPITLDNGKIFNIQLISKPYAEEHLSLLLERLTNSA